MQIDRVYKLVLFVIIAAVVLAVWMWGKEPIRENEASLDNDIAMIDNADVGDDSEALDFLPSDGGDELPDMALPSEINSTNPFAVPETADDVTEDTESDEAIDFSEPAAELTSDPVGDARKTAGNLPQPASRYEVKPGDSLGLIAQKFYGKASLWKKIAEANSIADPSSLRVGQKLLIPDVEVAAPPAESAENNAAEASTPQNGDTGSTPELYTVVKGDSLWSIAKKVYGSGAKWKTIYEANRKVMANSDALKVGMKLIIPKAANVGEASPTPEKEKDSDKAVEKPAEKKPAYADVEVINFFDEER